MICLFLVEINVRHLKFYILHFFYIGNPFQYYLKPCSSIFDKDYSTYFMMLISSWFDYLALNLEALRTFETSGTFYRTTEISIPATSL